MNTYIYILTDSNRNSLHVGVTDNLQKVTSKTGYANVSRLVYHETLPGNTEALRRFNEISRYTRMQKERLIRRHNPNWLDLSIGPARPIFRYPQLQKSRLSC